MANLPTNISERLSTKTAGAVGRHHGLLRPALALLSTNYNIIGTIYRHSQKHSSHRSEYLGEESRIPLQLP